MPSSNSLAKLGNDAPLILPSILMCDFGRIEQEIRRLEDAGVQALHLDVMDGHFVPNLSYGLPLVETFRRLTKLPLDVHLMIANPEQHDYLRRYRDAGSDLLTVHAEAVEDLPGVLREIRSLGVLAGVAINPPTPVAAIRDSLELCDLVLAMSVMPGFGGQTFDRVALAKLAELRTLVRPEVRLEIDGGINAATIADSAAAGAQWFVVGSAIFRSEDYRASVRRLTELAQEPIRKRGLAGRCGVE